MKLWHKIIAAVLLCSSAVAYAQLDYTTYASQGGSPAFPNSLTATPLSIGTVNNVNFDWGGGLVLDSGRYDGVIVRITGYYKVPGTGTQNYEFGIVADDGIQLRINNELVVDFWGDQGPTFRSGNITLTGGTTVPVEIWFYENGGGATLKWYWWDGASWQIVDVGDLTTEGSGNAVVTPSLCCGASAAPFAAKESFVIRANNFVTGVTPGDNRVTIQQIGNSSEITVNQQGKKNSVAIDANGSFNSITVTQSVSTPNTVNYAEVGVLGSSNSVDITQNSTGGTKGISLGVTDSTNTVVVEQKDSGNHYAEIALTGSNKTVNLTQQGSAAHMARIELTGGATSITTTQQGSTQQFYSITHNCAQTSCAAITVTQGQ